MKEIEVFEINVCFVYDRKFRGWLASFTKDELESFVLQVKKLKRWKR